MPVILYGTPISPPCRAVILLAKAIDLELEIKAVDLLEKQEHKSEAYLKINPTHTIPALDDNGFTIWESRAIMIYLVEKYAKDDKYYPKDIQEKASVNNMLFFDIGNLHKSVTQYAHPQMYRGLAPSQYKLDMLKERLQMFDHILSQRPFAAGQRVSIADMSLIGSVETAKILGLDVDAAYPNIAKWVAAVKVALPFYDQVTQEAVATHKKFITYRISAAKKANEGANEH